MTDSFDCAIIGGGPAGLVAALYLSRFRRSVLIADKGSSRAALIPLSHNYPGFPEGVSGKRLLTRLHQQIRHYGSPTRGGAALALEKRGPAWRVVMHDQVATARQVLFATGVVDRWPSLLGAEQAIEQGALRFCPICDGFEARDARVAVIGDGDHAAREALFVSAYSASVSLLTDGQALSPPMRARLLAEQVMVTPFKPGSLRFAGGLIHAAGPAGEDLQPYAIAYGALGVEPQTQLLASLGVSLDVAGCVTVDAHQQTSIPGLYAAGDVVRGLDQISVAVGEAAIAATAIHNHLREQDG